MAKFINSLTLVILALKRWRKTRLEALAEYHQGNVDTYERCVKEGEKVSGSLVMAIAAHTGHTRKYRHLAASIKVCLCLLAVGLPVGGWADASFVPARATPFSSPTTPTVQWWCSDVSGKEHCYEHKDMEPCTAKSEWCVDGLTAKPTGRK